MILMGIGLGAAASLGIILVILGIRGSAPPPLKRVYSDLEDSKADGEDVYRVSITESFSRTARHMTKKLPKKKSGQETFFYRMVGKMVNSIAQEYGRGDRAKQLAITGKTAGNHAQSKIVAAAGTGAFLALLIAFLILGGILNINLAIVVIVAIVGGALGFVLPDSILKTEATKKRREFDEAMYIWVDLTTQFLSTGEDGVSAMIKASALSSIWPFRLINNALTFSQLRSRPAHEGLRELYKERGIDSLKGLVEAMELSDEYGTELSEVIRSFVQSFRTQSVIDAEARVEASTEQAALPLGLVVVAFLLLLAYPGVRGVLNSGLSDFGGGTADISDFTDN